MGRNAPPILHFIPRRGRREPPPVILLKSGVFLADTRRGMDRLAGRRRSYRAVVIGCGRVGSLLEDDRLRSHPCTHAGFWASHPRTRLVAGCDIDPERRADFGARWKIARDHLYEDHVECLSREAPDIVSIATWTESHAEITLAAIRAGAKIILCEKPMAVTVEEADAMVREARRAGVVLSIHHERRWQPEYRMAKELIDSGRIGEVRTVVGNALTGRPNGGWHADVENVGGGPLLHDGTHLFDAMRLFCGEVRWVWGHIERRTPGIRVEDVAIAAMEYENGAHAFVEGGGLRRYFNFEIDVQGSAGRILIGNAGQRLCVTGPSPRYEGFIEFTEIPFPSNGYQPWFPAIVEDLLGALEEGRDPLSTGEDGRAALETTFAVYESARTGRRIQTPFRLRGNPLMRALEEGRL